MTKRILFILVITIASFLAVAVLSRISPIEHREGGFTRQWKNVLEFERVIDLKHMGYYIAGFSSDDIFLGHKNVPLELLKISRDSLFPIVLQSEFPVQRSRISVHENHFFVVSHRPNLLLRGSLHNLTVNTVLMESEKFAEAKILSTSSWILREINIKASTNVLIKRSSIRTSGVNERHMLEKQVDGIFCTDGILLTTPRSILYTYFYRNEIIVFDSSLHVTHRFHTIDTIKTANIQLGHFPGQGVQQLITPPPFVNRKAAVSGNFLFVNSYIKSSNELPEHSSSSAIDVYHLPNGAYKGSFYLPDYRSIPMKEFRVYNNYLYALHGRFLIKYKLAFQP